MATRRPTNKRFLFSLVEDRPEKGATAASEAIDHIREGFRWTDAQRYQTTFQIKDKTFAKIIGVSDRTLTRTRRNKAALDPIASDRLYRTARILQLAVEVFEDIPPAVRWLQREQPGLDGKVPLALLDTEPGTQAVETLLTQLEYSVLP
jgi:putative toxin-antitoxin system antitoxin component (TIGR02293 family)